jgi:DNA-binding protein YbaB
MYTPLENEIESALAELREQHEKIKDFAAAMAKRTIEVTSKNRMVRVKVDSQGKLVDLAFKGNRYRQIAPAELSALVVETVAKAQEIATKQTLEAAGALMPGGGLRLPGPEGLDLDDMFEAAMRLGDEPLMLDEPGGRDPKEAA